MNPPLIPDAFADDPLGDSPLHGFQGDRRTSTERSVPVGPTIAISRESGARGGSIAKRVGRKLGWQVFTEQHLDYLANDENARSQFNAELGSEALAWADAELARLHASGAVRGVEVLGDMPRLILMLAWHGYVIFVGRGAGFLLPIQTTLHVRMIAPLNDRIASLGQWLRLPTDRAAEQVRQRDQLRNDYLTRHFGWTPTDPNPFDLLLNSSRLGEQMCTELILAAVRGKQLFED